MSDVWTCTDCEAEIDVNDRKQHMKDEHGVTFSLPEKACSVCGATPCKRMVEAGA